MRLVFDEGTLLLEDAPDSIPHAEWDDRIDERLTDSNSVAM